MLTLNAAIVPSVRLAAGLSVPHFVAGGALWAAPLPVALQVPVTLAITLSLLYYLRRDAALRAPDSIVALEAREDGGIACRMRGGEWLECELLGSTYVSAPLTVINLKCGSGRPRSVLLVAGNADPRDYRRLRIWLRWKGSGSEPPSKPNIL